MPNNRVSTKLEKLQGEHDAAKDHSYLERATRNCRKCREIWRLMLMRQASGDPYRKYFVGN